MCICYYEKGLQIVNRRIKMEFVVCDDEKLFRSNVVKIIDKLFMNNDLIYEVKEFEKYDSSLEKLINTNKPKIYILDIEMKDSISGIDIARKIRKNDWDSVILIVTSHNELGYQAMKAQIMLLDFISKYDDCSRSLEQALYKAMELVNKKRVMRFETNGMFYVVYLNDILYVERDTVDRKCLIKTSNGLVPINKSLTELANELGDGFYMCHRSCLVNRLNIRKIDWKNNIIYFNNGDSINLISRDRKKGFKEYVNS